MLAYDAASSKWIASVAGAGTDVKTEVYEAGVQVGTSAKAINFDGTDFDVTEEGGYFTIEFAGTGMAQHEIVGAWHTETGLTGGHFLKADSPTAFSFQAHGLGASDVGAYTTAQTDSAIDTDIATHAGFTDIHHTEGHDFDTHTGDVDLADLVAGSRGSIIRRGAADWEEHALGTENYVLKAGATDVDWGQVDYGELSGVPSTFDPVAHDLTSAYHTDSGLTIGDFLKATGSTTFGFAAHGLTASDVGAAPAFTETQWTIPVFDTTTTIGDSMLSQDSSGTILTAGGGASSSIIRASSTGASAYLQAFSSFNEGNPHIMAGYDGGDNHIYMQAIYNTGTTVLDRALIASYTSGSDDDGRIEFYSKGTQAMTLYPTGLTETEGTLRVKGNLIEDSTGTAITFTAGTMAAFNAAITVGTISAGVSDYDKFLVSDSGIVKFRTGAEVATDIGAASVPLPLTDLAVGSQGSIIRRGAADWEEYTLGTTNYVLKAGASDVAWGQVDYSELAGSQPAPIAHVLATTGPHSDSLPWSDLSKTSSSLADLATRAHTNLSDAPTDAHHNEAHVMDSTGPHSATGLTVGWVLAADSANTFSWQAPTGGADADAIHDNVADEINQIADKASPVGADVLIIEDSAGAGWTKKKVSITNLPGGADADAIHDNVDQEIQVITPKGSPAGADVILIEDSAATWAKKSVAISDLPAGSPAFGAPTGGIDIGDAAVEGTSGDSTRADHQHAFTAPAASYPLDTANTESDGTASTPARSDHIHRLGAHLHTATAGEGGQLDWDNVWSDAVHNHSADGEGGTLTWANTLAVASAGDHAHSGNTVGGTLTWANALAVAAAGDHDHSGNTAGSAVPEASITFSATGHDHDGTGSENVDYTNLDSIPASFTPAAHVLATTGPHTDTLPLTDLAVGSQGSIIKVGASDWEELAKGTDTYVLKAGATDIAWGQVDYSELVGTQPAPVAHVLATTGPHTDTLPLTDLAVGSQGSVIVRGPADWEELSLSTTNYALVCTATDAVWAQYDYSWLANIPTTFDPTAHDLTSAYHTDSGLTAGHFLKADTTTTFSFQAHGLSASDVGALANVVEDTAPQLGGDLDLNEKCILMDPSLTTDLEYEGTVLELTVSALTVGQCVYVSGNNTGALADANAVGTMPAIGVFVGTNLVLTHGIVRQDTWTWTAGQRLYVGADGNLTSSAPSGSGDYVQIMGIAVNVDAVMIMPSLTEVKVA